MPFFSDNSTDIWSSILGPYSLSTTDCQYLCHHLIGLMEKSKARCWAQANITVWTVITCFLLSFICCTNCEPPFHSFPFFIAWEILWEMPFDKSVLRLLQGFLSSLLAWGKPTNQIFANFSLKCLRRCLGWLGDSLCRTYLWYQTTALSTTFYQKYIFLYFYIDNYIYRHIY